MPSPGDLPNPGIEPRSPTLQADSLPAGPPGKPKNTGVGSLSLLQQIFSTQESNWGLLHCRRILYCLSHQGSPTKMRKCRKEKKNCPFSPPRGPQAPFSSSVALDSLSTYLRINSLTFSLSVSKSVADVSRTTQSITGQPCHHCQPPETLPQDMMARFPSIPIRAQEEPHKGRSQSTPNNQREQEWA